jgi:large subunit ribosomal protein L30e
MDASREIRRAADTGKVIFGTRRTMRAIRNKDTKLVIVASNAPQEILEDIERYSKLAKIPVHHFMGTGIDLGTLCGKPFIVSVMSIVSAGESNILALEGR